MTLFKEILGWAGTVICLFFYISPIVTFRQLIKGQISVHEVQGVQTMISEIMTLMNFCTGWHLILPQGWVANALGFLFTMLYIIIWCYFVAEKKF